MSWVQSRWITNNQAMQPSHMDSDTSRAATIIGRRIRLVRQRYGLSLEDLGLLTTLNWTSIGKIERGRSSPTVQTLVALATSLGVPPGAFLYGLTIQDYAPKTRRYTALDFLRDKRGVDDPRFLRISKLEDAAREYLENMRQDENSADGEFDPDDDIAWRKHFMPGWGDDQQDHDSHDHDEHDHDEQDHDNQDHEGRGNVDEDEDRGNNNPNNENENLGDESQSA